MNSIDPTYIAGINAAAASTGNVKANKDASPSPKSAKDKVSISPEGRELTSLKHEKAVVLERLEVFPEVRDSILLQARERLMEGYYFSSDVTGKLADRLIQG